jgi:hypothetical protein
MALRDRKSSLLEDKTPSTRGAIAFMLVAFLGMIFIVTAKVLGLSQWQVTTVPVTIMLLYTGAILLPFLRLRDDQSGDNLYYLGFLYTLASIGSSLYQFSGQGSQEHIVTNFGIAITTTVLGLALRVAFNQMRQDPAEVERVARLELADAARRLRGEIDEAVLEFNHFRRAALQSGAEGHSALKEMMELTASSFTKVVEEYSSRQITAGEKERAISDAVESMASDAKRIGKLVKNVAAQLEKISTPESLVEINFGPALKKLEATLESIRTSQAAQAAQIDQLLVGAGNTLEVTAAVSDAAREVAERIAILLDRLDRQEQPETTQFRQNISRGV